MNNYMSFSWTLDPTKLFCTNTDFTILCLMHRSPSLIHSVMIKTIVYQGHVRLAQASFGFSFMHLLRQFVTQHLKILY